MAYRARKPLRRVLLAVHVIASVGWMGAGAANVVLAVMAATTTDSTLPHTCYFFIERLDAYLVIPLAFAALVTGIVVSVATPWGLTRHWWVLVKLLGTIAVIGFSTFAIGVWVQESIDATRPPAGGFSPVAPSLVLGAGANLVAFALMVWVSTAKPWGRTPWAGPT